MNNTVYEAVNPTVVSLGYEIVDIVERSEYGQKVITFVVDKVPDGVSLDDCERLHYAIEPIMDELDPTGGKPYVLEVSSPGLDRPLKTQRDFERNYGKEVEVRLYAPLKGVKSYEGVLLERTDGYVLLGRGSGETKIENTRIAVVRPLVKFD
ncbi:MAG TPA: ribosome maturation factor RimP [Firmicutes bacterium]|nr:ribosome maturation factor RimP [Bacillota bacterium]